MRYMMIVLLVAGLCSPSLVDAQTIIQGPGGTEGYLIPFGNGMAIYQDNRGQSGVYMPLGSNMGVWNFQGSVQRQVPAQSVMPSNPWIGLMFGQQAEENLSRAAAQGRIEGGCLLMCPPVKGR